MPEWVRTLHELALASRGWPVWVRYLATTLMVVGAFAVLRATGSELVEPRLIPLLAVVLVAATLLDRGNGLYATALSTLIFAYLMPPRGTLAVGSAEDAWGLVLYVLMGLSLSLVVEALHVAIVTLSVEHRAAVDAARDRQVLLDELAHRTKNDLTKLTVLLNLQARAASQETATALMQAADRVHAVARVHRSLSLSGNQVVVDSKSYIDELCEDLQLSLAALRPIGIRWHAERHLIDLGKAVPLGLIINEAVNNAVKHAFPDDRPGTIEINFVRAGPEYILTVADDGAGPAGAPREGSLGQKLMGLLATQLGGGATTEPGEAGGTVVRVTLERRAEKRG